MIVLQNKNMPHTTYIFFKKRSFFSKTVTFEDLKETLFFTKCWLLWSRNGPFFLQNADTKKDRNLPYELKNVCAVHIFALFAFFNYL